MIAMAFVEREDGSPKNKGNPRYDGKSAGHRFGGLGTSRYTPELGLEVIQGLLEGLTMREICERPHMPDRSTIWMWLYQHKEFRDAYTLAREAQAEIMLDEILHEAKNVTEDQTKSARVRIQAYQWRAERLNRQLYGSQITTSLTSPPTADEVTDVTQLSKEEYSEIARRLITEVATGVEVATGEAAVPEQS